MKSGVWVGVAAVAAVVLVASVVGSSVRPAETGGVVVVTTTRPSVPTPGTSSSASTPNASPTSDYEGSTDKAPLPSGAPAEAEIKQASKVASSYLAAINDYGYGDKGMHDFIDRAMPFMGDPMKSKWADIKEAAAGQDDSIWTTMLNSKLRHMIEVDGAPVLARVDPNRLIFAFRFKAADVTEGMSIPPKASWRETFVVTSKVGGTWLVTDELSQVPPRG